jgi:tRNA A-37 threonylcarbamoyl transferase component Bud32
VVERVDGQTVGQLVDRGLLDEARRCLGRVEAVVARPHARSLPHGDLTMANIIAADDGRTVLIDPVAVAQRGTALQDELCLRHLHAMTQG